MSLLHRARVLSRSRHVAATACCSSNFALHPSQQKYTVSPSCSTCGVSGTARTVMPQIGIDRGRGRLLGPYPRRGSRPRPCAPPRRPACTPRRRSRRSRRRARPAARDGSTVTVMPQIGSTANSGGASSLRRAQRRLVVAAVAALDDRREDRQRHLGRRPGPDVQARGVVDAREPLLGHAELAQLLDEREAALAAGDAGRRTAGRPPARRAAPRARPCRARRRSSRDRLRARRRARRRPRRCRGRTPGRGARARSRSAWSRRR